jgi:hypothetical protein
MLQNQISGRQTYRIFFMTPHATSSISIQLKELISLLMTSHCDIRTGGRKHTFLATAKVLLLATFWLMRKTIISSLFWL